MDAAEDEAASYGDGIGPVAGVDKSAVRLVAGVDIAGVRGVECIGDTENVCMGEIEVTDCSNGDAVLGAC